ncbi:hypothetical protein AR457_41680 (plasmid) [Streptomyces agglomeratus]|uniref:hypothetical protein n=1 Tax=Streptomyces agglomeratus TaxID=285458 RepID=UPI000853F52D|nr:hypothetical protein [Streptomyces agglomeratus]OEJ20790.1 hypothetical protein AR457_41680 [Streptomyces agglomeratus]
MFARFRRRTGQVTTSSTTTVPSHTPAPLPEADAVDSKVIDRAEELRAALRREVGVTLNEPEPPWFADLRAGATPTLDAGALDELTVYLSGVKAHAALSDTACKQGLDQIEILGVLKEMRAEGMYPHFCGSLPSADVLRAQLQMVRSVEAARGSDAAAETSKRL